MSIQIFVARRSWYDLSEIGRNLFNPIRNIAKFFALVKRANLSAHYFEQLSTLPDTELDRKGLRREDLAKVAFERYFGSSQ